MNDEEREIKFDVPHDFQMPDLGSGAQMSRVVLSAEYWDTPDHRLIGWGHSLRFREASDRSESGWTLKLSRPDRAAADDTVRDEVNAPGPRGAPPDELCSLLVAILVGSSGLSLVAKIATDRLKISLETPAGGSIEVDDDRVSPSIDGTPGPAFRQLEIEDKGSEASALPEIARRFRKRGAVPGAPPKLQKVLGSSPRPLETPTVRKRSSADVVVRSAIASGTRGLMQWDPLVRLDSDPEAVHKARVATRRLRSDLKSLEPALEARSVQQLREELAWLGDLLGAVRDLDVMIRDLSERVERWDPERRKATGTILAEMRSDRGKNFASLKAGIESPRYFELLDALAHASHEPPMGHGPLARRRASRLLQIVTHKAWRRMDHAIARLDSHPSDAALHEIRKRAKRARYAAESASQVFGRQADQLAEALAEVQDVLGEVQDTVVAEGHLIAMSEATLPGVSAFVAGQLVCEERRSREGARRDWKRTWRAARKKRLHRWL